MPVLVVAAEQEDLARVLQFQGEQEADHLKTLTAAVDVIAEEDIVEAANITSLLRRLPNVKEAHQSVVVAVDVTKDLDRRLQLLDKHRLLLEDLADLVDQLEHLLTLDVEGAHKRDCLLTVSRRQETINEERV